jgi:thiol-disulfide isomerase/thioredoxin
MSFVLTISDAVKIICLYFLPLLAWFTFKPYILKLQEAKNNKRRLSRLKFNTDVFHSLLYQQKQITIPSDGLGIDLGNQLAKNSIIKVCNPYCNPCSQSHPKIEKLLKECENVKVKIIFNIPDKETSTHFKPVSHFLTIAEESSQDKIIEMLDNWYLPSKKEYASFAEKHPLNKMLIEQKGKVAAMYKWCREVDIKATPTFFLNGYKVPDVYSIEELEYFLLE